MSLIIDSREKDLGGFSVRRVLPFATHRMVGPFIFFDHMGPAEMPPGKGINVRPHPHINLATVSYLFSGRIQHRDSLGNNLVIEPGAINWMTAGRGIVHSERTPDDHPQSESMYLNGIQLWVALPEKFEEIEPSFSHHPKESLPTFEVNGSQLKLLLGEAFGRKSPVPVHSDLFYLDVNMKSGSRLEIPTTKRESAVYLVSGQLTVNGESLTPNKMHVADAANDLTLIAGEDSRFLVIGGSSVGERQIFWNFVSSSKERIEQAKAEWKNGPRKESSRFQPIPGDDQEFIPL